MKKPVIFVQIIVALLLGGVLLGILAELGGSPPRSSVIIKTSILETASSEPAFELVTYGCGGGSPALELDQDENVHVVWVDTNKEALPQVDLDILYRQRSSSTNSWGEIQVVSTESVNQSYSPDISVDTEGNVHVVWYELSDSMESGTDCDVFYRRWNASAQDWMITEVISSGFDENSFDPVVKADALGNVHVVWDQNSAQQSDIFYRCWNASIKAWMTSLRISNESNANTHKPSIEIDPDNNIHVIWSDDSPLLSSGSDEDIFHKVLDFSSFSWSDYHLVSQYSINDSTRATISTGFTGDLCISWEEAWNLDDSGSDSDIFYRVWDSTTETWSDIKVASVNSTRPSHSSNVVMDKVGNLHFCWKEFTNDLGTERELYYRRWNSSTDEWSERQSFSGTIMPSLCDLGLHDYMAVDNDYDIHVTWGEDSTILDSDPEMDVFYRSWNAIDEILLYSSDATAPSPGFSNLPGDFTLFPINDTPDTDGSILLNWTESKGANSYDVHEHSSFLTGINSSVGAPINSTEVSRLYLHVSGLSDGTHYFIVQASNSHGNTLSNCIKVKVQITQDDPSQDLSIPSFSTILLLLIIVQAISLQARRAGKKAKG